MLLLLFVYWKGILLFSVNPGQAQGNVSVSWLRKCGCYVLLHTIFLFEKLKKLSFGLLYTDYEKELTDYRKLRLR